MTDNIFKNHDLLKESVEIIKSQRFMGPNPDLAAALRAIYVELVRMEKEEKERAAINGTEADLASLSLKGIWNDWENKVKEAVGQLDNPKFDLTKDTVQEDYIICLEDMTKHVTLKKHLKTRFQLSWEQYLEKYNLPIDYPSCCHSYSKRRSTIAKEHKLGTNGRKLRLISNPVEINF